MYILRVFINLILFIIIEYDDYSSNMKTHLKYIFLYTCFCTDTSSLILGF